MVSILNYRRNTVFQTCDIDHPVLDDDRIFVTVRIKIPKASMQMSKCRYKIFTLFIINQNK